LIDDARPGARQSAYRVRAAASVEQLQSPDVWGSGRVESDAQAQIEFAGKPLVSRQRVWWDVQLWDAAGVAGPVSEPSSFEMGLLDRADWQGQFVGSPLEGTGQVGAPSPLLRKAFELKSPVASARLYVTALGLYEASINGRRVGSDVFRPGWTDYDKRLNYQTYDVTAHVNQGRNVIGAMLGDGWYCGRIGALDRAACWGKRPSFLAQLEITMVDGSVVRVVTDDSWRWHNGPVLNSDLIHGEEYDARLQVAGWDTAACDDRDWHAVVVQPIPAVILEPSPAPPVRALSEIKPVTDPRKIGDGSMREAYVYDFGQNLTGVLRLRVRGAAGCTLVIRHAEVLKPDGTLDTSNLRSARVIDHYTLRGDPDGETYTPHFTFHGFRYAQISFGGMWSSTAEPKLVLDRDSATAVVLATDTPDTGSFDCDHALLNQLYSNIRWGMRGNFIEVPTDCPQRDERLGWTGDTQVFASTAAVNAEVAGFYTKWMRDLADAQCDNGAVPAVIPKHAKVWDWEGEAGWSDATVVVPWATYQAYGDLRVLTESYPAMKRWISYLTDTAREGIRVHAEHKGHQGFGDWLALDGPGGSDPARTATPKTFIATAHYAEALRIIANVATALGHTSDAKTYADQRETVVAAFNRAFVTPDGKLTAPSQTGHLLALAFDLLPESKRPAVVDQLVQLIQERDWHLTTGFLGTPLLCSVLARFGRADVAYRLVLQETYPSWLYPVTLGATTMWERWNSWHPKTGFVDISMNSLNHYAYGAVGKWIHASIGGIDFDPADPAYRRVLVRPIPGKGINRASASLQTLRGRIVTSWQLHDSTFNLVVHLPANMTGMVSLPDGTEHTVHAGKHEFTCDSDT